MFVQMDRFQYRLDILSLKQLEVLFFKIRSYFLRINEDVKYDVFILTKSFKIFVLKSPLTLK